MVAVVVHECEEDLEDDVFVAPSDFDRRRWGDQYDDRDDVEPGSISNAMKTIFDKAYSEGSKA
eukprot:scaffold188_cov429-Prasinococcus_capsulatus_cf.AAC.15